jgi:KTSC domain
MTPEQELQALDQLLDQLLRGIQDVLQSGEILSDEFQGMLAAELDATTTRMDHLREQLSEEQDSLEGFQSPAPQEPALNPAMPSSNINSFGYDDKTGRLLVKFQGDYPQENGPVYGYQGVPKVIFDLFRKGAIPARTDGRNKWGRWWKGKVPSAGASMYTLIKEGGYPYERLS